MLLPKPLSLSMFYRLRLMFIVGGLSELPCRRLLVISCRSREEVAVSDLSIGFSIVVKLVDMMARSPFEFN